MSSLAISWSSLRRYEECRHKQLRVSQGKGSPVKDHRVFLQGSVADRVMRKWLEQPDPQPGQMLEMVDEMMRKFTEPKTDDEKKDAGVIKWRGDKVRDKMLVRNFVREVITELEPWLLENIVPYDYEPEMRFSTPVIVPYLDGKQTSINLIGGIDIVKRNDEGDFELYDLKATKDDKYVRKVLGQGVFYDLAFGNYMGDQSQPKVFGFVTPACKEKMIPALITDDERRDLVRRIIRMAHGMWRHEWDPKKDDSGCAYCEVRHVCDKFRIDLKPDQAGRNRVSFAQAVATRKANR